MRVYPFLISTLVWSACSFSVGAQTAPATTSTSTTTNAPSHAQQAQFATMLATAKLAKDGITPKSEGDADYQRALDAAVKDIQAQRSAGMGWGAMANAMGLNWGKVVSESRLNKAATAQAANAKKHSDANAAQSRNDRAERQSGGAGKGSGSGSGSGNGGGGGGGSGAGKK